MDSWLDHAHMSYGLRPWWDGQMYAEDRDLGIWVVIQGMGSRTYSLFDPNGRVFNYLKPRLPLEITGEGNRAVIAKVDGQNHLLIYAIAQGNKMLRIKGEDISRINNKSPKSDVGSEFFTMHELTGASVVRRAATKPALGLMGNARGQSWYLARLKYVRFVNPENNHWTEYPGVSVGEQFRSGVCSAFDGDDFVYILTGGSKNFQRVSQSKMTAEKLADAPVEARAGAAMCWHQQKIYALMGGETLRVAAYDPVSGQWQGIANLPITASAAGSSLLSPLRHYPSQLAT